MKKAKQQQHPPQREILRQKGPVVLGRVGNQYFVAERYDTPTPTYWDGLMVTAAIAFYERCLARRGQTVLSAEEVSNQ